MSSFRESKLNTALPKVIVIDEKSNREKEPFVSKIAPCFVRSEAKYLKEAKIRGSSKDSEGSQRSSKFRDTLWKLNRASDCSIDPRIRAYETN